jgi:hypothetical protein
MFCPTVILGLKKRNENLVAHTPPYLDKICIIITSIKSNLEWPTFHLRLNLYISYKVAVCLKINNYVSSFKSCKETRRYLSR